MREGGRREGGRGGMGEREGQREEERNRHSIATK